jgi:hypothetical protein
MSGFPGSPFPGANGAPTPVSNAPMGGGMQDGVIALQGIVRQLSSIYSLLFSMFPATSGTFTFPAASSVTVQNPNITGTVNVVLLPKNQAAAQLMGSAKCPYISSIITDASFVVSTGNGSNATGTENFGYVFL